MKKFTALLAAFCILILCFSGCGKKTISNDLVLEDIDKVPEDSYEINWYIMADNQGDAESVEEAINEYLKDKINATVKLNFLPSSQYTQKMNAMINSSSYFDLCFVARWCLDYTNNAKAGAFFDLTDYLDTYLKETAKGYSKEVINCSSVNGSLYALPVNKEMATQYGWIYRKDIADKYNLDMSKFKTFEELEPVLETIKKNEPDIKYPIDWAEDSTPNALHLWESNICKDGAYPDDEPMNRYASEQYKTSCETARRFYEKGLVRPDVLTATDQLQRMKDGKTFVMLQPIKPGKVTEMFKDSKYDFAQSEVTDPYIDYLAGTGSMQAISATSKNPVRVMRFLNLLNTDEYLKNLVIHGIEGKHYKKIDDKYIEIIQGAGYDLHAKSWSIGNVFLDYLIPGEAEDKYDALVDFNKKAKTSRVNKFLPDPDDEMQQLNANIGNCISKYNKQLVTGAVETGPELSKFLDELKACEFDKYLDWIGTEWKAYLKTLK